MKYLFLLSLIMGIATCQIVELSDSNFKQEVEDTQTMWLVVFTAQWCSHCKHLKPQLEKAGEILIKWGVSVGIVGENNPKLVNQFVVDPKTHMVSYPKPISPGGSAQQHQDCASNYVLDIEQFRSGQINGRPLIN